MPITLIKTENKPMKLRIIALSLLTASTSFAGKIQNEDVKSQSDIRSSVATATGNLSSGNACVSSLSFVTGAYNKLATGQYIYDTTTSSNISANTTIAGLPGTCSAGQIQMSANAAGNGTGDTITVGGSTAQLVNTGKLYDDTHSQLFSTTLGQIAYTNAANTFSAGPQNFGAFPLTLGQISTPSNPSSGSDKLYFKSDDNLYRLTSAGVETQVGSGGGGTVTSVTASTPLNSSGGTTPNISLTGTVGVSNGGTGASSLTAFALLAGGTTTTATIQQIAAGSTTGQVLQWNGSSALPTWVSPSVTATVAAEYYASGSVNPGAGSPYNFDTQVFDNSSMCTTGASWKCTPKTAGNYVVGAACNYSSGTSGYLTVYKNGSIYGYLGAIGGTIGYSELQSGPLMIPMNGSTDYFDIRPSTGVTCGGGASLQTYMYAFLATGGGNISTNSSSSWHVETMQFDGGSLATVCSSDPCTIRQQSGSWVTAVNWATGPVYTIHITSGEFSAAPLCFSMNSRAGTNIPQQDWTLTQTATTVTIDDAVNVAGQIMCMGPK